MFLADLSPSGAQLLQAWQWVENNPVQVFGTVTGIGGALLLALRFKYSAWAWPVWIASNVAWTYWALSLPEPIYGQIAQNLVFAVINVLGTWRWLCRDRLQMSPAT